jgi:predicted RNase H-like nuclease
MAGFRLIDRVFMRGLFNNNNVGLQPNNPDLLDMADEVQALTEWCNAKGIQYSNDFPSENPCVLRETMPNPAFGILSNPADLFQLKRRLRFRYGRGSNVAPIVVAFECLAGHAVELFQPIENAPGDWDALEQVPQNLTDSQSDDLIAALVCGALAWWQANTNEVGFVREMRGHYLLPPSRMIHQTWRDELSRILSDDDFAAVETNINPVVPPEE